MKFDSYHPAINLIYFTAAISLTSCFNHPVFTAISYICAFAYSVKLNGKRGLVFDLCLIPPALIFAGWYSYYNHFGVTNLRQNFIGNEITFEALMYGIETGIVIITVIMFFSCVFAVFSSDKIVYLFGRVSPKLSLFVSILLRMVPKIKQYGKRINVAQMGIGRSPNQGNIWKKIVNSLRMISILITWTLENIVESSQSMQCRGYSLKGRTAFSIYRFDNRDRSFVIAIFLLLTITGCGWALNQANIHYDPQIIMADITPVSYVFYTAYGLLLLMPMIIQIYSEKKFDRIAKKYLIKSD